MGIGFSMVYGAMLTKTNRISRIFQSASQSARRPSYISPRSQLIITAVLVSVQFMAAMVWIVASIPDAEKDFPTRSEVSNYYPYPTIPLHSDAFFRSQRDINRHGSWLDFWKIQVNLVNFISGTFGTAWDKYSKNGLTFGCLREKKGWNFDLEIIFFKQKQDFGIFI